MDELINFFMDPLRLTLIIAGVAVLLAIIIFSRKSSKRNDYVFNATSSKEFSFGAKGNGGISDALARDTLVDEEIIVLPRKQKESESAEAQDDSTRTEPSFNDRSHTNAYGVKTGPRRQATNEFRAFQASDNADSPASADVFEEDNVLKAEVKAPIFSSRESEVSGKAVSHSEHADASVQVQTASVRQETSLGKAEEAPLKKEPSVSKKQEPSVSKEPSAKKEPSASKKPSTQTSSQTPANEMFVVLHIIAVEGEPFNGLDILDATKTQGMAFGKHAIFHYPMSAAPAGDSKFCLVNMSATGNFETNKISTLETNGISLIMRLPIRGADTMVVFSNMVGVAQALARKLGGEILDQARSPLTAEIIEKLRADIVSFESTAKYATVKEAAREAIPEI